MSGVRIPHDPYAVVVQKKNTWLPPRRWECKSLHPHYVLMDKRTKKRISVYRRDIWDRYPYWSGSYKEIFAAQFARKKRKLQRMGEQQLKQLK